MHKIMIVLKYGLNARSVFRTDLYKILKKSGCKLIAICPAANESYLQKELGEDVILELYPSSFTVGVGEKIFSVLANSFLFSHPLCTRTLAVKWFISLGEKAYLSFLGKGLAALFRLDRIRWLRLWIERIDCGLFSNATARHLINKYEPNLIVTTDLFGTDFYFVREAVKQKIETICLVKSWDNLTSKTRIRAHPDWMIVWSEHQKREAMKLHFFPENKILVKGALNFDHLANPEFKVKSKEKFLQSIGAKPNRKIILYSAANKMTVSDENNIRLINQILETGTLGYDCHLHVRKYPKAQKNFDFIEKLPNCSMENAGRVVLSWSDRVDQTKEDLQHAKTLLTHVDIVIQIGSTIALDAAYLDKPVFLLSMQEEIKQTSYFQIARYARKLTHNFYLEKTGGLGVISSKEELISSLKKQLDYPQFGYKKRKEMVKLIAGTCDGRVGQRIGSFILSRLNTKSKKDIHG